MDLVGFYLNAIGGNCPKYLLLHRKRKSYFFNAGDSAIFALTWLAGHCTILGSTCDRIKYEQWDQYSLHHSAKVSLSTVCGPPSRATETSGTSTSNSSRSLSSRRCTTTGRHSSKLEACRTSYGNFNGKDTAAASRNSCSKPCLATSQPTSRRGTKSCRFITSRRLCSSTNN